MHMSDALLSPSVGGAMWAASGAAVALGARAVNRQLDTSAAPLTGVVAAFVFAAQMVNFAIPGTGSSGHLGGGLLLAILLGPHAAVLAMASILTVQALFFADGGLLALGCNIFNLGVIPAYIVYPLLFRPLAGSRPRSRRLVVATVTAAVAALVLGASAVVLETTWSGVSSLPLKTFAALMLPIHAAIGIVEGVVTAAVVLFVRRARPEVATVAAGGTGTAQGHRFRVVAGLGLATLLVGGALSWLASTRPDGLEWAVLEVAGPEQPATPPTDTHATLEEVQERTALLPDYALPAADDRATSAAGDEGGKWPAVSAGTTLAGVLGGAMTLVAAGGLALILGRRRQRGSDGHGGG
jgi:cobalt/nickel transport system permease protein